MSTMRTEVSGLGTRISGVADDLQALNLRLSPQVEQNEYDINTLQEQMPDKQTKDYVGGLGYDDITGEYSIDQATVTAVSDALSAGKHAYLVVRVDAVTQDKMEVSVNTIGSGFTAYGNIKKATFTAYGEGFNLSVTDRFARVAESGSYNDLKNKPTIPTKTSELTNDSTFEPRSVIDSLIRNAVQGKEDKGYTATLPMTYDGSQWSYYLTPEMVAAIVNALNNERQVWLKVSLNGVIEETNNFEYVRLSMMSAVGSDVLLRGDGSIVTILCYTSTAPSENVEVEVMKTGDALEYAYKSELPTKVSDLSNDTGFITSSALQGYATEQYVDNIVGNIDTALATIIGE